MGRLVRRLLEEMRCKDEYESRGGEDGAGTWTPCLPSRVGGPNPLSAPLLTATPTVSLFCWPGPLS